jgi:hypothetical protein
MVFAGVDLDDAVEAVRDGILERRVATLNPLPDSDSAACADCSLGESASPLSTLQVEPGEKPSIYRDFAEPSDGLEPSTPSLPWND